MCDLKERPAPIWPLKTLDIIFRRRYLPNTQYYFTNRKHDKTEKKRGLRPFRLPKSEKLLSYIKYSDRNEKMIFNRRASLPLHLKENPKQEAARDLSQRLFITEPPDDVRAVVEIHPEFYSVIEGRPLRRGDDIKQYMSNIRTYAMSRQQIGYRRDLVLMIDRNIAKENEEYIKIYNNCKHHIKNFQKFLTEDYKKACLKVSLANSISDQLISMNIEFLSYINKLTIMKNIIFKLDATRSVLKIYRSYLNFVAPMAWRKEFDERLNYQRHRQSVQFSNDEFATDNDLVDTLDIDNLLKAAENELANPAPAVLYFTDPEQMITIFRTMEMQSREYLTQLVMTTGPYRMLQDQKLRLKNATKQELEYFQYYMEFIKNEIKREEINEICLQQKFFKVLNGTFYESVASRAVLKLKICVEFVYEQVFGKSEEGHANVIDPMKLLEISYEDYNLKLDSLDFKIVKRAQNDLYAQDISMMTKAYKAERELRAFREMTNAMNKAFYPPAQFKRPEFKKVGRGKKHTESKSSQDQPSTSKKGKKLTAEDQNNLLMFTNWCPGVDAAEYLKEYETYVKPVFEQVFQKESGFM